MGGDAVTAMELAEAVKARGLRIAQRDGGLTVSHSRRAGIRYLDEEITVKGRAGVLELGPGD